MQHKASQILSPTVRVHHSSPPPTQPQSMLAQGQYLGGGWNDAYHGAYLSALPKNFKDDRRFHKRASSGSSIASAGPPSPHDRSTIYPRIATSDATFSVPFDFDFSQTPQSAHTSKSLPISSDAVMFNHNHAYDGALDMRRIQSSGADDRASYGAPQSVSSMGHNSPATPHTNYDVDYEESKAFHGFQSAAYQQSMQDVFPDQTFQPALAFQPMQSMAAHRQNMMQERLQAAQNDHLRTNSPTSNPRDKSPFRQTSQYMSAPVQRPPPMPQLQKQRTSISPKELMLDEHDIDDTTSTPLFQDQSPFAHRRKPSNLSTFYTTSYSPDATVPIPQQYPFVSQQRAMGAALAEPAPEFPASLPTMDSTGDEGPSEPSSQQSSRSRHESTAGSTRPVDTSSDCGTYSCTYHGCTLRFESPAKLQKHKREGHRQTSPGSSAPNIALRNSQAGPHRCDRINPSTGKPCNSIFSRPYDLTRHEDTIHNRNKSKIRCPFCTDVKEFSRSDALARHTKLIHSDLDYPGKHRKGATKKH